MTTRSKVVELSGSKFEVRRLPPDVGSFIFMRMVGAQMRMAAEAPPPKLKAEGEPAPSEEQEAAKPTGEQQVRALSFVVFSGGMEFEDFKFIQRSCMGCVSRYNDADAPMPVMADNGQWTADGQSVADDVGLVMKLTTEVLVHCFASFFDSGGLGS